MIFEFWNPKIEIKSIINLFFFFFYVFKTNSISQKTKFNKITKIIYIYIYLYISNTWFKFTYLWLFEQIISLILRYFEYNFKHAKALVKKLFVQNKLKLIGIGAILIHNRWKLINSTCVYTHTYFLSPTDIWKWIYLFRMWHICSHSFHECDEDTYGILIWDKFDKYLVVVKSDERFIYFLKTFWLRKISKYFKSFQSWDVGLN